MKTPKTTRSFKVGAVVLATDQGLGYLAKSFYDNGLIDQVYVHQHSTRVNHNEWYTRKVEKPEDLLEFCDVILFFEDPFYWKLIPKARDKGKKTVLIPMYECTRFPFPYEPDLIITPSKLDEQFYAGKTQVQLPIPVSEKWRLRERAVTFVHNAGNGGLGGRNGTQTLLQALPFVKSPDIKFIIRSQVPMECKDPRVEVRIGQFENIWDEGDVFVFPEKFNGLSLPIQEAYASGMLVMATKRFPNTEYLPGEPLIPVHSYKKERIAVEFQSAQILPQTLATVIDKWYNRDISSLSLQGKEWGEQHSWTTLKGQYEDVLSRLLAGQDFSAHT